MQFEFLPTSSTKTRRQYQNPIDRIALTERIGIRKLGGQSPRKLILEEEEPLNVSEIPDFLGKLPGKTILREVQQLKISDIGPAGRQTPGEFVTVEFDVDQMFHSAELRGEGTRQVVPLQRNGLYIRNSRDDSRQGSLDPLSVEIDASDLTRGVADNPGPEALFAGS